MVSRIAITTSRQTALAISTLVFALGCEPKPETVREWADYKDGPRKIAALIADAERSMELRVTAATILVDLGEVFPLADGFKASSNTDRTAMVQAMAPKLMRTLEGKNVEEAAKAKDALFYVGGYLPEADREKAGRAIIAWATDDFSGRFAEGKTTLAQVLPEMGTASTPPLLKLLEEGEAIPEIVKILASFRSQAVHDAAAEALLGLIDRLGDKAPPEALANIRRLQSPRMTPFLLGQLRDPKVSAERKDEWFEHLPKCGGPEAGPGLAKLLEDHDMRWIAAQALLELEGADGIRRVLSALPANDKAYSGQELFDEIAFFCTRHVAKMKSGRVALQDALVSGLLRDRPLATATAATCLKDLGGVDALPALKRVAAMKAPLPGWKGAGAVGGVVKQAMEEIARRGE